MERINSTIDRTNGIPYYIQVEKMLRELIEMPEYQKGKLLPNEVALSKQLGVARSTVRQALNNLLMEGLIERKRGVGTKVTTKNIETRLSSWHSFTQEMNDKGVKFDNIEINIEWVKPKYDVFVALNVKEGKKLLKLTRVRGEEGKPLVYFTSIFHPKTELTGKEDYTKPLYDILENEKHIIPTVSREKIKSIIANEFIAEKLKIEVGAPVLYRRRLVFDAGGTPIEYNVGYYNAEEFSYSIDIKR
jgi:GntR family transcriptional regulator